MRTHPVGVVTAIPTGGLKRAVVGGRRLCVIHAPDGNFYAIDDECTHEGSSLSDGEMWDMEVECPTHMARFDVRTGAITNPPALLPVRVYPVTISEGQIFVEIPEAPDAPDAPSERGGV